MTAFPLDPLGVYRVAVPGDPRPRARLCIAPRALGRDLSFFDTLRERRLEGAFVKDPRAPRDAVCFQVKEGARLWIEPLTLKRFDEVREQLDGQPRFSSEAELRSFFLGMVR